MDCSKQEQVDAVFKAVTLVYEIYSSVFAAFSVRAIICCSLVSNHKCSDLYYFLSYMYYQVISCEKEPEVANAVNNASIIVKAIQANNNYRCLNVILYRNTQVVVG